MKTIKNNIILLLLTGFLLALPLNSCNEDNLDLQPMLETEESYFKDDYQFFRAMMGVYAKFTDIYWFNNNNPRHYMWMLPGDDLTSRGNYSTESFSGIIPSEGSLNDIWTAYYRIITRCNLILEKIEEAPNDPLVSITSETNVNIKGEALFIRSLAFFKLWNYWGTAPLMTARVKDLRGEIKNPNSKDTELLHQAIVDLTAASELLPANWDQANLGRATKEAAYGLMGKCLIFRANYYKKSDQAKANADYTAAITSFNKITSRSLVPYSDNFDHSKENNAESLFEWQASQQAGGFENIWLNNDFGQDMSMHAYWGFFDMEWSFWAGTPFIPTQKLVNAFEPGDTRIAESFASTEDAPYNGYRWVKYTKRSGPEVMTGSLNNPRILRYADVLLLKAEAVLQSGGSASEAIGLINQVRTRARGTGLVPADLPTAETNTSTIMQWIMDERFRELAGEDDHRWLDLKRWDYAGYINLGTWGSDVNGFSSIRGDFDFQNFYNATQKKLWFPIPSVETEQNEKVVQNPY